MLYVLKDEKLFAETKKKKKRNNWRTYVPQLYIIILIRFLRREKESLKPTMNCSTKKEKKKSISFSEKSLGKKNFHCLG